MGDLGPLRQPPKGWLPARAMPLGHRVTEQRASDSSGGDALAMHTRLQVQWEIHVDGRDPYRFDESRKAPMWASPTELVGSGNRWYKLRARRTHGLLAQLGVPGYVDPQDPTRLWVDWDAAYEEHLPAWDRKSAVEREVARRRGPLDRVVNRISEPFAPKIAPEDQQLVEAQLARDAEREAREVEAAHQLAEKMGYGPSPDEQQEYARRNEEALRIYTHGREVEATVVALRDTGRTLIKIPLYEMQIDVHDGATRRIDHEQVMIARLAKRYAAGKRIKVRIDPDDENRLALA
jgi:hypothetical protein